MSDDDRDLAEKVLTLRRAGARWDSIANQLNITPTVARGLFDKVMRSYDPELNVALEADRLDRLHMAVWPSAVQGDVNAVDRVLRISERRDKVVTTPRNNTHALREAFDESARTSEQLHEGWDVALLEAGRKIADRVDEAVASGEGQEVTKALYLVPHMLNVLREMLATPAARANAAAKVPPAPEPSTESRVAQLRSMQVGKRANTG
jgi:hypothetical protein